MLLFLNVCKQTFHISHVSISQKVKDALMWNVQHITFIWRRRHWQNFKSALVYFKDKILYASQKFDIKTDRRIYKTLELKTNSEILQFNFASFTFIVIGSYFGHGFLKWATCVTVKRNVFFV